MVFMSEEKMSAPLDEADLEAKTPMKRIGSTRKLLVFNNIRLQLNDQLRCLDARVDAQAALAAELQDYFRRRADVEADYSRGLDKLAKTLQLRHKEQKHKREQWPLFSSYTCWQQLVGATKALARDHAALAELYGTRLVARLQSVAEDVQRVYKRCREIGYETHEEILRVLGELQTAMKTHQQYAAGWRAASTKLRTAQAQRARTIPAKKLKLIDKEIEKRRLKHADAKLKALKARSEYLLCLEAANTTIHKYFVDDLSDLIDCMDLGFHNCISRALRMQASADEGRARALQQSADTLYACIDALDSRLDKQKFLEAHHQAFMIPRKLSYQGQQPDEEDLENATDEQHQLQPAEEENRTTTPSDKEKESDSADVALRAEMEARLSQLEARIRSLRAESSEACKTLETAETTLLQMVDADDWETSHLFGDPHSLNMYNLGGCSPHDTVSIPGSGNSVNKPPEQVAIKARADRHETEEFYLSKFREYLLGSGRIARLEAKAALLRGKVGSSSPSYNSSNAPGTPTPLIPRHRRRICGPGRGGRTGLFAASLDEHLELTRRELPLVLMSCIRVINLYGLQHQGIFRVSGSQVEISALREWFERGEDPLAAVSDASDINSVAGLLKLYLRELRPPLIPIIYFDHLIELSQLDSKPEFVTKMSEFVSGLPRPAMVLLRYLFAFLNHLSEFSDENMMDPWNLAICFGPTLIPVPEDKDQVQYQNQVNDLIKNIIIFHEEIFVRDGGPVYEKYQTLQGQESEECPQEATIDDVDSETSLYPSEDEQPLTPLTPGSGLCPLSEETAAPGSIAVAAWSWKARAPAEISVRAGDHLKILARRHSSSSVGSAHSSNQSGVFSNNGNTSWYLVRCLVTGREGLVPEGCITTNAKSIRDDDFTSRHSPSMLDENQPLPSQRSSSLEHILDQPPTTNNTWPRHNSEKSTASGDEACIAGNTDDESCEGAETTEVQRRKHSKSQSVGNTGTVPFSLNREIWQQRASNQLKHTPDLVMDLPAKPDSETLQQPVDGTVPPALGGAVGGAGGASPTTGAERFAQNQHNTLKKKPNTHDRDSGERELTPLSASPDLRNSTDNPSEAPSTPPLSVKNAAEHLNIATAEPAPTRSIETSPVPPRNTKRVAAKFADLTLTGGSLKPQVAAKPAVLLRRQPPVGAIAGKPISPPVVPTTIDGNTQV